MFQFKSLQDVVLNFSDEKVCVAYLEKLRWDGKPICPHCLCEKVYRIKAVKQPYKCAGCKKKFSVKVGLIFEASNIPLPKWFIAIYLSGSHKKGISSCQLARDLGVTQKTAWFMLMRIREMMRTKRVNTFLTGTVEVDETYVGGKFKNKHKAARAQNAIHPNHSSVEHKTGIMGFLERGGELRMKHIHGKSFPQLVGETVSFKSILITDALHNYARIGRSYVKHEVISHQTDEFVRGEFHTNSIEGAFSHFKRMIFGIYIQVSKKHITRYCDEYAYRFNSRTIKDGDRFILSLKNTTCRLPYKELVNK